MLEKYPIKLKIINLVIKNKESKSNEILLIQIYLRIV